MFGVFVVTLCGYIVQEAPKNKLGFWVWCRRGEFGNGWKSSQDNSFLVSFHVHLLGEYCNLVN